MQVTNVDIKSDDDFIEQEETRELNEKLKKVIKRLKNKRDKQKELQPYIVDHLQEIYDPDEPKRR